MGSRILIAFGLAVIAILMVVYLLPGKETTPSNQSNPHAIDQPG